MTSPKEVTTSSSHSCWQRGWHKHTLRDFRRALCLPGSSWLHQPSSPKLWKRREQKRCSHIQDKHWSMSPFSNIFSHRKLLCCFGECCISHHSVPRGAVSCFLSQASLVSSSSSSLLELRSDKAIILFTWIFLKNWSSWARVPKPISDLYKMEYSYGQGTTAAMFNSGCKVRWIKWLSFTWLWSNNSCLQKVPTFWFFQASVLHLLWCCGRVTLLWWPEGKAYPNLLCVTHVLHETGIPCGTGSLHAAIQQLPSGQWLGTASSHLLDNTSQPMLQEAHFQK